MKGWIRLHRKLNDWKWYKDLPTRVTFLHLLLNAKWQDKTEDGVTIKRGQIPTGSLTTPKEIGISRQQFRRAMSNLIATNEITTKATTKGTLVTIVKYDHYQPLDDERNHQNNHQNNHSIRIYNNNTLSNDRVLAVAYESETDFLAEWKRVREHYENKPTNLTKLTPMERTDFNKINTSYSKEQIRQAMEGLFQQKGMFPASKLRPSHFLSPGNVDKYLDCYNNKTQLYA